MTRRRFPKLPAGAPVPKIGPIGPHKMPLEWVKRMHADYQAGMSLSQVARRHHRSRRVLCELFRKRGLSIRPYKWQHYTLRAKNGCYLPAAPKSEKEIERLIDGLDRIRLPDPLRFEWRKWTLAKRAAFIARMRRRINPPGQQPPGPFSKNVIPFEYGSPEAHGILDRLNAGLPSRNRRSHIRPGAQGLIWRGRLFFWDGLNGYHSGSWHPETGRPYLHRMIWEEHNGRPVPAKQTVVYVDANKNNLDPSNLALRSMAACARENMCRWRIKKARQVTSLLLSQHQDKHHESDDIIEQLRGRGGRREAA